MDQDQELQDKAVDIEQHLVAFAWVDGLTIPLVGGPNDQLIEQVHKYVDLAPQFCGDMSSKPTSARAKRRR